MDESNIINNEELFIYVGLKDDIMVINKNKCYYIGTLEMCIIFWSFLMRTEYESKIKRILSE